MAALASAALVFGPCAQPPAALAVSGGTSGSATGYSYQDQSGKDFRGLRLTKAEMRQTKFDGANFSGERGWCGFHPSLYAAQHT